MNVMYAVLKLTLPFDIAVVVKANYVSGATLIANEYFRLIREWIILVGPTLADQKM